MKVCAGTVKVCRDSEGVWRDSCLVSRLSLFLSFEEARWYHTGLSGKQLVLYLASR